MSNLLLPFPQSCTSHRGRDSLDCSRRFAWLLRLHDNLNKNYLGCVGDVWQWHQRVSRRAASQGTYHQLHLFQWQLSTSSKVVQRMFSNYHRRHQHVMLLFLRNFVKRAGGRVKVKKGDVLEPRNALRTHQQNLNSRICDHCVHVFSW